MALRRRRITSLVAIHSGTLQRLAARGHGERHKAAVGPGRGGAKNHLVRLGVSVQRTLRNNKERASRRSDVSARALETEDGDERLLTTILGYGVDVGWVMHDAGRTDWGR